ncbi:MAG: threonine synthase, partial [Desulfobacterales bacterium]
ECLAGLAVAVKSGMISSKETAVLDSTAHALKFSGFQEMYFEDRFPPGYEVIPDKSLINAPVLIRPEGLDKVPTPGKPLAGNDFNIFVKRISEEIAGLLNLKKR